MNRICTGKRLLVVLATVAVGLVPATAEDKEKEGKSPMFGDANTAEAFQLFPVGKPWTGVRVPRYNEKEELVSLMDTKRLTRENDEVLQLDGLTVVMFKGEEEVTLRLKTKQGLFNIRTGKLRSRYPANIEHSRFVMRGDRMEFDADTQMGKLNGNVEMEIFDTGAKMPIPKMTSNAQNTSVPETSKPAEENQSS